MNALTINMHQISPKPTQIENFSYIGGKSVKFRVVDRFSGRQSTKTGSESQQFPVSGGIVLYLVYFLYRTRLG